jgi:ubiquinone/menaquinone biosynthesis C-methylase UbiE
MAREQEWQLEGSAPELYERYLVPAITSLWAADLVRRAAPQLGERVLDVACGTGVVARLAARAMGKGRVIGLDINAGMLAVARSRPVDSLAPSIEWLKASALDMPLADRSFDLILCQLGLQFFPDRTRALQEIRRLLVPDGRVALSVFTAIEHTPVANALAQVLDRHLGTGASTVKRSEHSLCDASELHRLVAGAGFRDIGIQPVTQIIKFPSAREYVRLQLAATPQASLLKTVESAQRDTLIDAITADLSASLGISGGALGLTSPQEAHVLLARN